MSLKKFVVIPLIIAVLAFTIQIVDQLLSPLMQPIPNKGFCWIAFQAWAVYFFAGANLKGGLQAILGYAVGIVAAILLMELAVVINWLGFFTFPAAVAVVACCLIFFEKAPWWLSLVPAMFIGAGAFFAFMTYIDGATYVNAAITEIVYCAIGLAYGFVTIVLRAAYEKRMK